MSGAEALKPNVVKKKKQQQSKKVEDTSGSMLHLEDTASWSVYSPCRTRCGNADAVGNAYFYLCGSQSSSLQTGRFKILHQESPSAFNERHWKEGKL